MLDLDGTDPDSLVNMLKMSFSCEYWPAIIQISEKLFELTAITYEMSNCNSTQPELKRDIVYYFGYSLLMKGIALQKMNRFSEARECIGRYKNLDWIKNLSADGLAEIEYFRNISIANTYVIDLLEGKIEVLPHYVEFIRNSDKEEILAGLITVLESAIRFNYSIDWIINEFKDQIRVRSEQDKKEEVRYYLDYLYLLAAYYYKQRRASDTINLILEILILSDKLEDSIGFRKSVAFYEMIRDHATKDQQQVYRATMKIIVERVFEDDEKNFISDDHLIAD
ncbi:hypothetical protein D3C75_387030 [compost metagenome]